MERSLSRKENFIEREVSFHLGVLFREFESGFIREENVFNADETNFLLDTNDSRTIAMKGDKDVKFADVVSADMGMSMMVMLGHDPNELIEMPMFVFQNSSCSYPIRVVPDDFTGACYRSVKKNWMDRRVLAYWISEKRIFSKITNGEKVLSLLIMQLDIR